jgi:hypothetical protein
MTDVSQAMIAQRAAVSRRTVMRFLQRQVQTQDAARLLAAARDAHATYHAIYAHKRSGEPLCAACLAFQRAGNRRSYRRRADRLGVRIRRDRQVA